MLQLPTLAEAQAEDDAAAREAVRSGRVSSALLARSATPAAVAVPVATVAAKPTPQISPAKQRNNFV